MATKILVVYDVQVKNPEVPHVQLIINYGKSTRKNGHSSNYPDVFSLLDLPKAVEEYAHRYGTRPVLLPSKLMYILPPVLLLL